MPRLRKRRKRTLEKRPLLLLEVWHQIRPKLIGQIAHHVLFISSLVLLASTDLVIALLFSGLLRRILVSVDFLLFLVPLLLLFRRHDS